MERISTKTAGIILTYRQNVDMLNSSLKSVQRDIDESLQKILTEASYLVKINKKLKEIDLHVQAVKSLNENKNASEISDLLTSVNIKLMELRNIIVKETQKNILKSTQALIASQNGLMILSELDRLIKSSQKMIESE